jgi:hypothetical protein
LNTHEQSAHAKWFHCLTPLSFSIAHEWETLHAAALIQISSQKHFWSLPLNAPMQPHVFSQRRLATGQ